MWRGFIPPPEGAKAETQSGLEWDFLTGPLFVSIGWCSSVPNPCLHFILTARINSVIE